MKKFITFLLASILASSCVFYAGCTDGANSDETIQSTDNSEGTIQSNDNDVTSTDHTLLKENTSLPAYEDHGERMMISFMNEPRSSNLNLDTSFEVMADAGITTYMPWGYKKEYESFCEQYNLKYLPHTEDKTPQQVSSYLNPDIISENIIGFYYRDEPTYDMITGYTSAAQNHQTYYSDKYFLVNLLPDWINDRGEDGRFGGDYIDYVEHFCDVVFSQITSNRIISVDCYPLNNDGTIKPEWLTCYETIAKYAKQYDADFHFYIANTPHWGYRTINVPKLRYMVNVAMTYGGNALSYFSYVTYADKLAEGWGEGLVKNSDGITPTSSYYVAQQVNFELLNWDHVFLNFDWEETMCIEGTNGGLNNLYQDLQFNVASIDIINTISASVDTLIGRFTGKDNEIGLMVTNFSDPKDNLTDNVEMNLKEANTAIVYVNGQQSVKTLTNGKLNLSLASGDAAFVIPIKLN